MIIGVTGGVGTGKSTILDILKNDYQAAIIMADDVSRDLMMPGGSCYKAVVGYFGKEILEAGDGSPINRAALAQIVFNDPEKLNMLNNLNHPLVRVEIEKLVKEYTEQKIEIIVIETAILIQAGYLDLIDEMWLIETDYDVRVERLTASRGYSIEKINSIISNQLTDAEMERYASFVINNSGTIDQVKKQISNYLNHAGNNN